MYGQTEASQEFQYCSGNIFKKKEQVGKPLRGSKITIIDKREIRLKK